MTSACSRHPGCWLSTLEPLTRLVKSETPKTASLSLCVTQFYFKFIMFYWISLAETSGALFHLFPWAAPPLDRTISAGRKGRTSWHSLECCLSKYFYGGREVREKKKINQLIWIKKSCTQRKTWPLSLHTKANSWICSGFFLAQNTWRHLHRIRKHIVFRLHEYCRLQ